jgi:hypothetical protein
MSFSVELSLNQLKDMIQQCNMDEKIELFNFLIEKIKVKYFRNEVDKSKSTNSSLEKKLKVLNKIVGLNDDFSEEDQKSFDNAVQGKKV